MKKINKYILALIITASLAIVFLGFSIGAAFYTVNRAKTSIDEIGKITVDSDLTLNSAKDRLDKAIENYEKLDRNIKLDEKIDNIETLNEKKKEFVNTSIKLAISVDNQKVKLSLDDNAVSKYVKDIDEYQKAYITIDEFKSLEDYDNYLYLYEKYKDLINSTGSSDNTSKASEKEEEIEIC